MSNHLSPNNCPIREHTADGVNVGRCFFHCPNDVCPRHGDVSEALELYRTTGSLTNDSFAKKAKT